MSLNFSPLDDQKPTYEASPLTDIPAKFGNGIGILVIWAFAVPLDIGLLVLLAMGVSTIHQSWSFLVVIVAVIGLPMYQYKLIKKLVVGGGLTATRISNFAVSNSFNYKLNPGQLTFKGMLSSALGTVSASSLVSGRTESGDFKLFNLLSGKGLYVVLEYDLTGPLQHIFVDNRKGDFLLSNLTLHFDQNDALHLEGGFDKTFIAYSKDSPSETLSILSPDFMTLLLDFANTFDIEIVEDRLYIIAKYKYLTGAMAQRMFDAADHLMPKINRRLAMNQATQDKPTSEASVPQASLPAQQPITANQPGMPIV